MSVCNVNQMICDGAERMISGIMEFDEPGIRVWSIWVDKDGRGITLGEMTMAWA